MGQVEILGRGARRKAKTREKLMEASRKLLTAKGLEGVSIQDITDEADVGLGSFYNHFESKMDVLQAVADEYLAEYDRAVRELVAELDDVAEIVCVSCRYVLSQALDKQSFAIIEQMPSRYVTDRIAQRAIADMNAGTKAGRWKIENPEILAKFATSGLLGVMRVYFRGEIKKKDANSVVMYYLRLLGVEEKEAKVLVAKPMPKPKLNRRAS